MFDSLHLRRGTPERRASRFVHRGGNRRDRRTSRLAIFALLATLACGSQEDPSVPSTADSPGRAAQPSLILIVIDTVRADRLGIYGYERNTSPELDRWASSGAVFERAFASSSWTLPSFASIYTGQHPGRHGAGESLEGGDLRISRSDATLPMLAEIFSEAGYATVAFANNPFLHEKFGVARGFDDYSFVPASNSNIRDVEKTTGLALDWIDRHREVPFFAMVHYFDPHMDYAPPQDLRGTFAADYDGQLGFPVSQGAKIRNRKIVLDAADKEYLSDTYDEELLGTDRGLGKLLAGLSERKIMHDALVILTSDHGEEIFDHGSFEHGHTAYQELLHVPLVIWGPGISGRRITQPVSHVDLFATALEAAGLQHSGPATAGVSLLAAASSGTKIEPRPILADRTLHGRRHRVLIEWPYKSIEVSGRSNAMLFDLSRDPGELDDLAEREPSRLRDMIARFEAISPSANRETEEQRAVVLDDALRARLEALGYAAPSEEGQP